MWKQILRKENPIMNFKKALFCASFGLIGTAVLSFSFFNTRTLRVNALEKGLTTTRTANYDSESFPGEEELSHEILKVRASSSSKSTLGQSFNFYFSTGGTGYQDSTKTFTVAPNDPDFESYYEEFSNLTEEEKEAIEELAEKGEYQIKQFVGQLYSLNYQASQPSIYVPETLSRGVFFQFKIGEILSDALTATAVSSGISKVYIPRGINTIYEDSFTSELPASFEFNVEFLESEIPATWAENWNHGATVNYGVEMTQKQKNVRIAGSSVEYGDKETNFIIGYYPTTGTQYPLVMSYKLVGGDETQYFEFSKSTTSSIGSIYDAVGYKLYGFSNNLNCDLRLDLNDGAEVDFNSIVIHNIFEAKQDVVDGRNAWVPDTTKPYFSVPAKGYSETLDVNDLITYKFKGISTFGGYTSIDLTVNQAGNETYAKLKSSFYKQYEENIKKGKMYVRYRFTSLTSCNFNVIYSNGSNEVSKIIPIETPVNQHVLSRKTGNFVSFLFKNSDIDSSFSAKSVRQLSFISFYVTLDIFDKTNGVVARSSLSSRFGYFMVMPYQNDTQIFDINLMLIIMSASYAVLYALASVAAFFYMKNKFKNDEFRRVKPKSFWLKALLGLVGGLIVILFITFVVIRSTAFNNAIVVYNPVDAYIIIFAVASVLVIGYFIKYLVGVTKANKDRKRNIKLKLTEDVADDGTK